MKESIIFGLFALLVAAIFFVLGYEANSDNREPAPNKQLSTEPGEYRYGFATKDAGFFVSQKYGPFCFDYASGTSLECSLTVSFTLNGDLITKVYHIPKKDFSKIDTPTN